MKWKGEEESSPLFYYPSPSLLILTDLHVADSSFAERPLVMGVVNITPDSFSDGGYSLTLRGGRAGHRLIGEGADIIDIGGESTRRRGAGLSTRSAGAYCRCGSLAAGGVRSRWTPQAPSDARGIAAGAAMVNDVTRCPPPGR